MEILKHGEYKRPALPLLFSYIAGIVIGSTVVIPSVFIISIILAGLFTIGKAIYRKKTLRFIPLVLLFCLGILSISVVLSPRTSEKSPHFFSQKTVCTIRGQVDTQPEIINGKQKFILKLEHIESGQDVCESVSGKIRVTITSDDPPLRKGDTIELVSRLRPFRNFYNPGGFDYERFMALKDIWASAYVKPGMFHLIQSARIGALDQARSSVSRFIDQWVESESARSVLKALLIGDRQEIRPELREEFNQTGTSHLLAISGLHVGIVAGVSYYLLYWIFSHITSLLWNAWVRKSAGLLTLIPVLAYGLIAGMAPSTQRAVMMVAVVLLTYCLEADHDIMNSLGLAALAILIISPEALFGVSFQLSFAAVFFIIWGMGDVASADKDEKPPGSINQAVRSYALVSLFAYLGTLPLVAYYFNQISIVGLGANIILVPLVGFLVVPLGLGAMFIYPFSSLMASILIRLAGFFIEIALKIIHGLSTLPFSSIKTINPTWIEIMCYYGLLVILLMALSAKGKRRPAIKKSMQIVAALVMVIVVRDIIYWVHHRFFHRDLRVTVLDVGQGSASLVEFPNGPCMMIDGGGFTDNDSFDMGQKVIAPFLWSKKIATVDTVVLSHPESDHLNGLLYILDNFHVNEFWFNGQWRSTKSCERLKDILVRKNIKIRSVTHLPKEVNIHGAQIKVLWPMETNSEMNTNDACLVVKINYGNQSFLFPGDITKNTEKAMVQRYNNELESQVLVVPHHGSKTSSSALFIDKVKPEYAVISAGYRNRYSMPHKAVLKRLTERGINIYRTDMAGAILMITFGNELEIKAVLNDSDRR